MKRLRAEKTPAWLNADLRGTGKSIVNRFIDQRRESLPTAKTRESACFLSPNTGRSMASRSNFWRIRANPKVYERQEFRAFRRSAAAGARPALSLFSAAQKRPDATEQDRGGDYQDEKCCDCLPVHIPIVRFWSAFGKSTFGHRRGFAEDCLQLAA